MKKERGGGMSYLSFYKEKEIDGCEALEPHMFNPHLIPVTSCGGLDENVLPSRLTFNHLVCG